MTTRELLGFLGMMSLFIVVFAVSYNSPTQLFNISGISLHSLGASLLGASPYKATLVDTAFTCSGSTVVTPDGQNCGSPHWQNTPFCSGNQIWDTCIMPSFTSSFYEDPSGVSTFIYQCQYNTGGFGNYTGTTCPSSCNSNTGTCCTLNSNALCGQSDGCGGYGSRCTNPNETCYGSDASATCVNNCTPNVSQQCGDANQNDMSNSYWVDSCGIARGNIYQNCGGYGCNTSTGQCNNNNCSIPNCPAWGTCALLSGQTTGIQYRTCTYPSGCNPSSVQQQQNCSPTTNVKCTTANQQQTCGAPTSTTTCPSGQSTQITTTSTPTCMNPGQTSSYCSSVVSSSNTPCPGTGVCQGNKCTAGNSCKNDFGCLPSGTTPDITIKGHPAINSGDASYCKSDDSSHTYLNYNVYVCSIPDGQTTGTCANPVKSPAINTSCIGSTPACSSGKCVPALGCVKNGCPADPTNGNAVCGTGGNLQQQYDKLTCNPTTGVCDKTATYSKATICALGCQTTGIGTDAVGVCKTVMQCKTTCDTTTQTPTGSVYCSVSMGGNLYQNYIKNKCDSTTTYTCTPDAANLLPVQVTKCANGCDPAKNTCLAAPTNCPNVFACSTAPTVLPGVSITIPQNNTNGKCTEDPTRSTATNCGANVACNPTTGQCATPAKLDCSGKTCTSYINQGPCVANPALPTIGTQTADCVLPSGCTPSTTPTSLSCTPTKNQTACTQASSSCTTCQATTAGNFFDGIKELAGLITGLQLADDTVPGTSTCTTTYTNPAQCPPTSNIVSCAFKKAVKTTSQYVCQGQKCTLSANPPAGAVSCTGNGEGTCYNYECQDNKCVRASGGGSTLAQCNSTCGTRSVCDGIQCVTKTGSALEPWETKCTNDASCQVNGCTGMTCGPVAKGQPYTPCTPGAADGDIAGGSCVFFSCNGTTCGSTPQPVSALTADSSVCDPSAEANTAYSCVFYGCAPGAAANQGTCKAFTWAQGSSYQLCNTLGNACRPGLNAYPSATTALQNAIKKKATAFNKLLNSVQQIQPGNNTPSPNQQTNVTPVDQNVPTPGPQAIANTVAQAITRTISDTTDQVTSELTNIITQATSNGVTLAQNTQNTINQAVKNIGQTIQKLVPQSIQNLIHV